jgi:hypothetical protein
MSPGATFVASDTPGFIMLRPDDYEVINEAQGAPASEVFRLAWLNDRLYIAYRDALASFDPKSRSFQLIASSITVEPRNPLDGRGSFFVLGMFSDEVNNCLWLEVQDNVLPRARSGIWKFEPQSNRFEQIHSGRDWLSWTEGGLLVHLSGHPTGSPSGNADPLKLYAGGTWSLLDPRTSRLTALAGYGPSFVPPELRVPATKFVKVGEHIIDQHGQLYTPDGKRFQVKSGAKWDRLERVGSGFVTHFDDRANVLWYIEPKKPASAPSLDEPPE